PASNTTDAATAYYAAVAANNLPSSNTQPICVTNFTSASTQVVSGTNYKINLVGCPVADIKSAAAGCTCSAAATPFTVTVYQRLTGTPLVTLVAPGANVADSPGLMVGAFSKPHDVTAEDKAVFAQATGAEANFANSTLARVCALDFVNVATQVVSGTNYLFTVKGCALATATANADCKTACASKDTTTYGVKIYQTLTQTTSVTDVLPATKTGQFIVTGSADSSSSSNSSTTTATTAAPTTAKPSSASLVSVAWLTCFATAVAAFI
ncbi:hypothetical protein As57867_003015, partial [Aphanomyces stellatus]